MSRIVRILSVLQQMELEIPKESKVSLIKDSDILGKEVATIVNDKLERVITKYEWNGTKLQAGFIYIDLMQEVL